ncbi:hypothetical protein B0I35DRAFT_409006 [Stachybotrys elegans]|uniref:PLD phosphodiesterase domain-containing protein n=1 Tax=Stachybotrys elegans TaxID=80388 RepID=A0A8K0WQ70_9HYPO|nr:hypothetical protein B0I35DRAFT_409006 [Stachybotrys elegans]
MHDSLDYRLRTAPAIRAAIEGGLKLLCTHILSNSPVLKGSPDLSEEEFNGFFASPLLQIPIFAQSLLSESEAHSQSRAQKLQLVQEGISTLHQLSRCSMRASDRDGLTETPQLCNIDSGYHIIREWPDGGSSEIGIPELSFDVDFEKFVRVVLSLRWLKLRSNFDEHLDKEQKGGYGAAKFAAEESTIASQLNALHFKQAPPSSVASSSLSTSTTHFEEEVVSLPPPPTLEAHEKEKMCPYCCLVLPAKTFSEQRQWKRHLVKDLRPYICLCTNCDQPGRTYDSLKDWRVHLNKPHYRSWRCLHPDHVNNDGDDEYWLQFDTTSMFRIHLKIFHPDDKPNIYWGSVNFTSQYAAFPQWCFVCLEHFSQPEILLQHVSKHLKSMSLLALPWRDDMTADEVTENEATIGSNRTDNNALPEIDSTAANATEELEAQRFRLFLSAVNDKPHNDALSKWLKEDKGRSTELEQSALEEQQQQLHMSYDDHAI